MRVLVCNPPWPAEPGWRGQRAGCLRPRLVPAGEPGVAWPAELASAVAVLRRNQIDATLIDSLATGESASSFLHRLDHLAPDVVALAVSPASLASDWPQVAEVAARVTTVLVWSGERAAASRLLDAAPVRAVVCGEPELGLLAATQIDDRAVYPADPVRDLDALPRAWRDHTVHLYRPPIAGLPDGPVLPLSVGRGAGRWRGLESVRDEIDFCRTQWPRLGALWLVDAQLDAAPERFAALAAELAAAGWPWAAHVGCGEAIALADGAAALEIELDHEPEEAECRRLRRLAAAGVALTLAPAAGLDLTALTRELGARLRPRPDASEPAPVEPPPLPIERRPAPIYVVGDLQPVYLGAGLLQAAREAGRPAIGIDVWRDPAEILLLLEAPRDAIAILDRGVGLPPDLIGRVPARTVLYSPEILPTAAATCDHAETRYAEFAARADQVTDVILHDAHPLAFLEAAGHANVRGVVPLPVDSRRFRDHGLARDIDVLFVGSPSEHRENWMRHLAAGGIEVTWPTAWGETFIELLNRAKIVLNLHYTPLPNTELRVAEALACGACVATEPLTDASAFRPGEQVIELAWETAAETLRWWLEHPAERAEMAARGRDEVLREHTCRRVLEKILALLPEAP